MNTFDIWKALVDEEKKDAYEWFLKKMPDGKACILSLISKKFNFRPEFVLKWEDDKILEFANKPKIYRTILKEEYLWDLEFAWLLYTQKEMLVFFLENMHVPHKGGLITDGYDKTITVSTFEKALKKLWERYDHRYVSIYISFLLLETDGIWKNLPVVVDKFGRNNFTDACAVTQTETRGF